MGYLLMRGISLMYFEGVQVMGLPIITCPDSIFKHTSCLRDAFHLTSKCPNNSRFSYFNFMIHRFGCVKDVRNRQ